MVGKWMKMLLAMLLAVMLPMTAMADMQYTFSVTPGEMLVFDEIIADLCEAVAIRLIKGERSSAVGLVMNDKPMITIGFSADSNGLYAASAELLDDILHVGWDDLFAYAADNLLAAYGEGVMDAMMIQNLKDSVESLRASVKAWFEDEQEAPLLSSEILQGRLKMPEDLFADDPAMTAYLSGIIDGIVVEQGMFSSDIHDTADKRVELRMDAQDLIALFDTAYMRSVVTKVIAASGEGMTEDEKKKEIDELIEQVKKIYGESDLSMVMQAYTADGGEALVCLDLDIYMNVNMDAQLEEGQVKLSVSMNGDYNRLTSNEGVSHTAVASVDADDAAVKAEFDLFKAENGITEGMLGMLSNGEEIVMTYCGEPVAEKKHVWEASIYTRSGATAILQPSYSARPMIGLKVVSELASDETLQKLENASEQNSLNIFKMTETEMQNLLFDLLANCTQLYYHFLGALPTSFLNMMIENSMI